MGNLGAPARPGTQPTRSEIQPALDRSVRSTIVPLSLGLAFVFGVFALTDRFTMDAGVARTIAAYDLVVAAILLVVTGVAMRWPPPQRHASTWVAALAGLVAVFGAAVMRVRPEPIESIVFIMLVLGAGVVLLSFRWLTAVVGTSLAAWTWAALTAPPHGDWVQYGQALLAACVLSGIVLQVRLQALTRAEALRIMEERARTEHERIRQTLEDAQRVAHIGNWSWDIPVDRVEWSPELYRLFGLEPGSIQVTYQRYLDRVHPEDRAKAAALVEDSFRSHQPFEFEHRVVWPDQSVHWLHSRGFVVLGHAAAAGKMVGTAQDIDDRKRAEKEEREAQARVEEIERLRAQDAFKTQFINEVAHELNTPLTPIQVQLELLKILPQGELSKDQAQALQIIERNVRRFGALIEDVLDAARLQGRNLGLRTEPLDLSHLIREVVESFAPAAQKANIAFDVAVPADLAADGDAVRLTQVLYNLLTNAIKYSPDGGRIELRAHADKDQVTISVRDSGIGVRREDIHRLFQPFSQTHDPGLKVKGTGLGLYVSRGIIELHHGRMWCESEGRGKGSTFAFSIPARAAALASAAPGVERSAEGSAVTAGR